MSHGGFIGLRYVKFMSFEDFPSLDLSSGFAGKLIVAMPHLHDTPFERAVCLICSHDDEHAFGVVVNKPIENLTVSEVVNELNIVTDEISGRAPVHFGGPVDLQRGAVLHSLDFRQEDTVVIAPGIGLTATKDALQVIAESGRAPRHWLLVMGHAGWDGGQLENEIKRNDWLNLPLKHELIFGAPSDAWDDAMVVLGITDLGQFEGNESPVARPN